VADRYLGSENDPNRRPEQQEVLNAVTIPLPTPAIPRSFKTAFDLAFLSEYHRGTMNYTYKGISCLKDPIDLALYIKLIWELKPKAIIEIGSFHGGSAVLYADLCKMYCLETQVITVDFRAIQGHSDHQTRFIQADALHLEQSELHSALDSMPRPWLIIEDSAHTFEVCYAVLNYFKTRLHRGDVLIIEDGVVEDQDANAYYHGGPNLAISRFFTEAPQCFRVMEEYTDFFGRNATFNPNGYLQKL
jgi:cephalosporin hydroxylase